jgi:hypothetical protein
MTTGQSEVLGTCDKHFGEHEFDFRGQSRCVNWKPVAAPEKQEDGCPNCGRSDGWHKAEGHPPPPVGDCRKIVWLSDGQMEWWGIRAYGNHGGTGYDSDYCWMNNGAKESATVLFWMDGPHNPNYPAPPEASK